MNPQHRCFSASLLACGLLLALQNDSGIHPQRFAVAIITSCEQTEQTGASQPSVKSFHMDKVQILEHKEGPKAVTEQHCFSTCCANDVLSSVS